MSTGKSIVDYVANWLWPTYRPKQHNYFLTEYNRPAPAPAPEPLAADKHTQFVGYNPEGQLVKATPLPFVDETSTDFATIRAYAKNKPVQANVEPSLTARDREELAKRKPVVPESTAVALKEVFAARGGNITATELATVTNYSKSYVAAALSAFRAALPRD